MNLADYRSKGLQSPSETTRHAEGLCFKSTIDAVVSTGAASSAGRIQDGLMPVSNNLARMVSRD